MPYTYRLFDSIDKVDVADWQRVSSACCEPIFSDRRFIAAVESGMRRDYRFWHAIVYNERSIPVACASLSVASIDFADLADPRLASVLRRLPRALSRLRNFQILFCGLPVSIGQHSLALIPESDPRETLSTLERVTSELAKESRAHVVVYKDFGSDDLEWTSSLLDLGYRQVATLPMYSFTPSFADFQQYCGSLRSHYRYKVNRSIAKLHTAGIKISICTEAKEIINIYTPEVHNLYLQVVSRAAAKLETLSIEFFHQLATRLRGQVDLVLLSKDSRVVAFGWCLTHNSTFHMLFAGLDYELNTQADLYFNLMYAWLDRALRKQPSRIDAGQTAGAFKTRLGCYSEPLYTFVKGRGPFISLIVRLSADFSLTRREPAAHARHVFKIDDESSPALNAPVDEKSNLSAMRPSSSMVQRSSRPH
jgi:hypothetical protein